MRWPMPMPSPWPAGSPTPRRAPLTAERSRRPWVKRAKAPCSAAATKSALCASVASAPGEGDLFQPLAADTGEGACHRAPTAAPIKVAGTGIAEQCPDDEAVEPTQVERVPAALEQVLAESRALIERIQIKFVNFALIAHTLARVAERRVARNRAPDVEHQRAVTGLHGITRPVRRALAHHAVEMAMRDNSAIGEQPGLLEDIGVRLPIGRFAATHPHLCTRAQHGHTIARPGSL